MNIHVSWIALCVALSCALEISAATVTKEESRGEDRYLVLENDYARIVVFPDAGAAITEYVDKATGTNLVAGTAKRGSVGYAWKEVTRAHPNDLSRDWFGAKPYKAEFKKGDGFQAIVVTCDNGPFRAVREMRLADDSAELRVLLTYTNIGKAPSGIWARWHPYMTLDDPFAEASFVALPGPGPDQMRKFAVGAGWDSNQMDVPGYWLAMNEKSGFGVWMTFRKEHVVDCSTWTDYNFTKHPKRGWFTMELFPKTVLLQPGDSTELHCAIVPFHAGDDSAKIPMGFVAKEDHAAAKRFLALVRSNAAAIHGHSMVPEPNDLATAIKDNRFFFSHKRRDRFALQDWGIADAMMAVPAVQTNAVRLRLYGQAFESWKKPVKLRYELSVTDCLRKVVARQTWEHTIHPAAARNVDKREEYPISRLADGWYTFTLRVFADDRAEPIHTYVERRKLNGQKRPGMAEARRNADAKPLAERERPFVTALRRVELPQGDPLRVPIGVEEAGGIARKGWPVRTGVPFAQGQLKKDAPIRVTSPDGKEVPAQTSVMGTWMDGSVKWLLVQFPADVPANGHAFYQLELAPGKAGSGVEILSQQGDRIRVDTGIAKREFSTAKGEKILGMFAPADLWWETGEGKRYEFRLEGEEAGVAIEENGPLRGIVRVTGWYYAQGESKPIARGELRAEFYRGQKSYRLYHTVTYAGDPWQDTLGGYGIRFHFSDKAAKQASVELDGKILSAKGALALQQIDEDRVVISEGNKTIVSGQRASGAASLTTDSGVTMVFHRDLWRLHPKKIEADPGKASLTFHYWPKEAGAMDWRPREDGWIPSSGTINALAVGASRTHEFVIEEGTDDSLTEFARKYGEPVLAVVAPRYVCATGALLHLQPYDPDRVPALEQMIRETFDSYLLN